MRTEKTNRPTRDAAPRAATATATRGLPPAGLLKGDEGDGVRRLQRALIKTRDLAREDYRTGPGTFGPKTEAALKGFQGKSGLEATGVFTAETRAALRKSLAKTRASRPPPAAGPRPPAESLKKGSKGPAVDQLQRCLVKTGHLADADYRTGPGIFGSKTEAALKRFQKDHALTADGAYGPASRAALAKALGVKPPKPQPSTGEAEGLYWNDGFKNRAALTFDDGPHPTNTPKVLDILKKYKAKATFFVTGENAARYPALIKRIVAEGHTLGAHSWAHGDQSKLSQAQVVSDMKRTEAAIVKALGKPYDVQQFRPPYGAYDTEVKNAARKLDNQIVLWTVDSNDWRYRNDDAAILRNVFEGSNGVHARGGTLLFHDIHPQTVRILDDVLARLKKSGFKIEKTDQFLYEKYGANA